MKEEFLTQREVQFLFNWFISTTKGDQCEPIYPSNKATQEDKDIFNKLKNLYKGEIK